MWAIYSTGLLAGLLFGGLTVIGSVLTTFMGHPNSANAESMRAWVQIALGSFATAAAWTLVFGPLLAAVYAPMRDRASDAQWAYLVMLSGLGLLIAVRGFHAQPRIAGNVNWLRYALPATYGLLTPVIFGLLIPLLYG